MSVVLAATWHPRGETLRFRRLYPDLARVFPHMVVVVPPTTHAGLVLSLRVHDKLTTVVTDDWPGGRRESLEHALSAVPNTSASHLMYADMDRLLRWAETNYDELRQTVKRVQIADYLVIGRTPEAYATHPQALVQTERISNEVFSALLEMPLDLSAGAKGMSIRAAQFIVRNTKPGRALGADSEWTVLCHRRGFRLMSVEVNGLDWESADRYQAQAADYATQQRLAKAYDADPANWAHRANVAHEIVEAGLDAMRRQLMKLDA